MKTWISIGLLFLFGAAAACDKGGGRSSETGGDGLTGGERVFRDDFERAELGSSWNANGEAWRIENGAVHVANAQNDALWLSFTLPEEVRVEFDAVAEAEAGDLKFEIFGDGETHESGYIAIFGGWNNQVTCIARLDEHGDDRLDAPQHDRVAVGRTYRIAAVRTDHRFRWYIDGELVLSYDDSEPLRGEAHRYFAFNNWEAPAHFDNLEIYDLSR